jgi:hypothetical protein
MKNTPFTLNRQEMGQKTKKEEKIEENETKKEKGDVYCCLMRQRGGKNICLRLRLLDKNGFCFCFEFIEKTSSGRLPLLPCSLLYFLLDRK